MSPCRGHVSACPATETSVAFELTHLKEEEKYKTKTILSSDLYQTKKKQHKGEREEIQEQYIQMAELHLITVVYIHWTKFTSFYINLYV